MEAGDCDEYGEDAEADDESSVDRIVLFGHNRISVSTKKRIVSGSNEQS